MVSVYKTFSKVNFDLEIEQQRLPTQMRPFTQANLAITYGRELETNLGPKRVP